MDRESGSGGRHALDRLILTVSKLAVLVALDRRTDPKRVLPVVSPRAAWRTLPRLFRSAADAGEGGCLEAAEVEFLRHLADTIEKGHAAPVIDCTRGVRDG